MSSALNSNRQVEIGWLHYCFVYEDDEGQKTYGSNARHVKGENIIFKKRYGTFDCEQENKEDSQKKGRQEEGEVSPHEGRF